MRNLLGSGRGVLLAGAGLDLWCAVRALDIDHLEIIRVGLFDRFGKAWGRIGGVRDDEAQGQEQSGGGKPWARTFRAEDDIGAKGAVAILACECQAFPGPCRPKGKPPDAHRAACALPEGVLGVSGQPDNGGRWPKLREGVE